MKTTSAPALSALRIPVEVGELDGDLRLPPRPVGLVLFAHGSGSGRRSPRNRFVAETLASSGCATLLFDLLTADEAAADEATGDYRFDIPLLARRLAAVTRWVKAQPDIGALKPGYFGASTGAAAALVAAAEWGGPIAAVVSRGGRPDLAAASLPRVKAPTLLIVRRPRHGGAAPQRRGPRAADLREGAQGHPRRHPSVRGARRAGAGRGTRRRLV